MAFSKTLYWTLSLVCLVLSFFLIVWQSTRISWDAYVEYLRSTKEPNMELDATYWQGVLSEFLFGFSSSFMQQHMVLIARKERTLILSTLMPLLLVFSLALYCFVQTSLDTAFARPWRILKRAPLVLLTFDLVAWFGMLICLASAPFQDTNSHDPPAVDRNLWVDVAGLLRVWSQFLHAGLLVLCGIKSLFNFITIRYKGYQKLE
ncbi:hypothetical protein HDU91_000840 [Kappamyces sp. JEL0680]|nr:hypothetical protein HDU91_000840 [Kappamyces sp. JEL0680]